MNFGCIWKRLLRNKEQTTDPTPTPALESALAGGDFPEE